jgi:hypothetical protein
MRAIKSYKMYETFFGADPVIYIWGIYLETVTECRFLKKFEKPGSKSEEKLNAEIHLLKAFFLYL